MWVFQKFTVYFKYISILENLIYHIIPFDALFQTKPGQTQVAAY